MWQDMRAQLLQVRFLCGGRDLIRVHGHDLLSYIITTGTATYLYDEPEVVSSHRQRMPTQSAKEELLCSLSVVCGSLCVCVSFKASSERPSKALQGNINDLRPNSFARETFKTESNPLI